MSKPTLKPLSKGKLTRTPGSPAERVQMLAQGWSEAKSAGKQTESKTTK